jgi:hypothetical protein
MVIALVASFQDFLAIIIVNFCKSLYRVGEFHNKPLLRDTCDYEQFCSWLPHYQFIHWPNNISISEVILLKGHLVCKLDS